MTLRLLSIILLGWLLGCFIRGTSVTAQNPALIQAVDSVSGLPVNIQTDGSNALKVQGQ